MRRALPRPPVRPLLAIPLLVFSLLVGACESVSPAGGPGRPDADPSQGEVPLGSRAGWGAYLLLDQPGTGVWCVRSYQVFEQYGSPEVVALDDLGRCNVLVSYSGKWTPLRAVHDGKWLAPAAQADVDPRIAGAELYVGGQRGNVYQVVGHRTGVLESRLVAEIPGYEVHTILAGELDPTREGAEVVVFTRPGVLYVLKPDLERGAFEVEWVQELPGRVRDALVLPALGGATPWIATLSRAGSLQLMRFGENGLEWQPVHEEPMGMGRLAMRPLDLGPELVLYSTCDDGRVLRHDKDELGRWRTRLLFAGPQGPRGLVAGRFTDDPARECVALFGYSGEVILLADGPGGWTADVLFEDLDRGHWLAAAELDGRNGTPELLASGYSGRVVMLARPPGYGLRDVVVYPDVPVEQYVETSGGE